MRPSSVIRSIRRFPPPWWACVLALAALSAVTVSDSISRAEAAARRYGDVVDVAVAKRPLSPGTVISTGDVVTESRPRSFIPHSEPVSRAEGMTVVTPVDGGDVIVTSRVAPEGLSPVAALLGSAEQGVAVPLNESMPPLRTGDIVDVVGGAAPGGDAKTPGPVLTTRARVIKVDDRAATLAVVADEAPGVAYAAVQGAVTLLLNAGP